MTFQRLIPNIEKRLKIDPVSETAGRLRARQIRMLVSTTPLMMAVITAIAIIVTFYLRDRPGTELLMFWTAGLCVVSTLGYLTARRRLNGPKIESASPKAPIKVTRGVLLVAMLWAILPTLMYPGAEAATKITLVAVIGGILGGGAMSLYVVPHALFAFTGVVAAGMGIGLARSGESVDFAVMALMGCYSIALMRGGWTLAVTFAESVVASFRLKEKNDTIGVLLKDFSESSSDWLWQSNSLGQLVHGIREFEENLGTIPECFCNAGRAPHDFTRVRGANAVRDFWLKREAFTDVQVSTNTDGKILWVSISGKPLFDSNGEFSGFRGVATNITKNKEAEERIAYLAHNDALTGLVNRLHFTSAITSHLAKTGKDDFWAVMFLDLDGFKLVNDSKGHGVGDKLLESVAQRIKKINNDQDVVARLGGDEFAILIRGGRSVQALSTRAEKIIDAVSAPYPLDGQQVSGISVSIGIAIGNKDGRSAEELLHNADLALYRAKNEGKRTYRFFEIAMDDVVRERRLLEQDLRNALAQNEFSVTFQPLVCASESVTEGFEALVRWHHPEKGTISPSDFIPIAESMGLISDIGEWVLIEACRKAVTWPEHLFVAVNLSPHQFHNQRIISSVTKAIVESGISPSRLELEVTEGLLMENTEDVTHTLRELKGMGVSVALDDFGTGYSSLSYLLKFPFDKLKIDRSFISAMETDEVAKNVLEAIARLGNVLDLKVTAEGIETVDQVRALSAFNCTHFQGFLFGKPLSEQDLAAYMLKEVSGGLRSQAAELEAPEQKPQSELISNSGS